MTTRSFISERFQFSTWACATPKTTLDDSLILALTLLLGFVGAATGQGVIQFARANYNFGEGTGTAIMVAKCEGAAGEVTVHYATSDLVASNGVDYIAASGTLTFTPGQTNASIMVPLINDGLARSGRNFRVTLSEPSEGAVLGAISSTIAYITDNDSGIGFALANYTVAENAGAVYLGVVRGDDNESPVSVDIATVDLTAQSGVHYAGFTNTLSFTRRDAFFAIPVSILNNSLRDGSRNFRVTLSNPNGVKLGPQSSTTVIITDDDLGFRLESATNGVSEDAGFALVKVLRGVGPGSPPATVDYATTNKTALSGSDYVAVSSTLAFAAGESEKYVAIPILNDGLREATKTFGIGLSNPSGGELLGAPSAAIISIFDNDPGVSFVPSRVTNAWGASQVVLTVVRGTDQLTGPFTVDYATVDGSAKAGADYEYASGKLEFAANETARSLPLRLLRTRAAVGSKIFGVALSNPTGGLILGGSSASVNIQGLFFAVAAPFDPALAMSVEAGVRVLRWTGGGQLLRSDHPDGPWVPLPDARSPWNIPGSGPAAFYRIQNPRVSQVYVPSSYDGHTPMPLVFALHGYTGSGESFEAYVHFLPLAESREFLYCYPDGTFDPTGNRFWCVFMARPTEAASMGYTYIDDIGFLHGIIAHTARQLAVDPKRIYLYGHSNGAYLSHWMALNFADLIAGIGTLAGTVPALPATPPSEPVNVLHIHGTADTSVPYTDFLMSPPQGPLFGGAMHTVAQWADYNGATGCVGDPASTLDLDSTLEMGFGGLDTTVTRYTKCPPGGAVELWTINGAGHVPSLSTRYSPLVVDWLLAHPKP